MRTTVALATATGLVATATTVGLWLNAHPSHPRIFAGAPPLFAIWLPHVGPGTPLAILIAVAVIYYSPRLTLATGYLATIGWTLSLALIDGWQRGIVNRLTTVDEYLHEVPSINNIHLFLRGFATRILDFQPNSWTVHVAGHPPGATLIFVWLARIGLGGGAAAGLTCIIVGGLATIAVPITLDRLGLHAHARTVLPFLVLFPGAVWAGVSADGLFAGLLAVAIALLVCGAVRLRTHWSPFGVGQTLAGGLLFGYGIFCSYGYVLYGLIPLAVLALTRSWRALVPFALGFSSVILVFLSLGFNWLTGEKLVTQRYYQGIGGERPYSYWVWANLAALCLVVGPAVIAGLANLRDRRIAMLCGAALIGILLADATGLSKAETERIWLPFAIWLLPAAVALPTRHVRAYLASQAGLALAINHLLLTNW
jgi:hypothetical protein